jgi:osmotically-inducible protein OsmY
MGQNPIARPVNTPWDLARRLINVEASSGSPLFTPLIEQGGSPEMKRRSRLILVASTGLMLAFSALAQEATPPPAKDAAKTLTPMEQGNNKADLATTAQIRKDIMAEKNLSVNAQNVKIITNAGKVTLRGLVNTAAEKRLIGEIAEKTARPENVDNQLEVTAPPKP